jgi:membrane protein YdbS with pleckstrin-like domain
METSRALPETKIAHKYYIWGILAYLVTTIGIIVAKIIYWESISLWWIFLPSGITIGYVLLLLFLEMNSESR